MKKEAKPKEKVKGSVNKFLGQSEPILPPPPEPRPVETKVADKRIPGWLYHKTKGRRLFTDLAQYKAALKDGWVDTPAKFK